MEQSLHAEAEHLLLAQSESAYKRVSAIKALTNSSTNESLLALRNGLDDADATVRWLACNALCLRTDLESQQKIRTMATDVDCNVRLAAIAFLASIPEPDNVATIYDVARWDSCDDVRIQAIALLAKVNARLAVSAVNYWLGQRPTEETVATLRRRVAEYGLNI